MPIAKNVKFFYLNHEETVVFSLTSIGGYRNISGIDVWELGVPFAKHISRTPFAPSGKKMQVCAGAHCELCGAGFKPTKLYPVHIIIRGEQYASHDGTDKIYEMPTSAHDAIVAAIQGLRENDKTEEEIMQTEFVLTRLKPGQRPFFTCLVRYDGEIIEEPEELTISQEDLELLKKLDSMLRAKKFNNPRGAMYRTLKEKYNWPEAKIQTAFDTVLTDEGFLKVTEDEK